MKREYWGRLQTLSVLCNASARYFKWIFHHNSPSPPFFFFPRKSSICFKQSLWKTINTIGSLLRQMKAFLWVSFFQDLGNIAKWEQGLLSCSLNPRAECWLLCKISQILPIQCLQLEQKCNPDMKVLPCSSKNRHIRVVKRIKGYFWACEQEKKKSCNNLFTFKSSSFLCSGLCSNNRDD